MRLRPTVIHRTLQYLALARAAGAVATTVWQRVAVLERGFEYRFIRFDRKAVLAGLEGDGVSHD